MKATKQKANWKKNRKSRHYRQSHDAKAKSSSQQKQAISAQENYL